ncbi:cytochrome P-450, putative [Pediculus humanus corporis]|uniref:Cytochrome P-450, putative n=1 Tax=Pediculus humanus subsp. corporis TaxID=121224 RepID=E0VQ45_PEDHC|nr:cytochrome P-450, putative [Pediculus humanus corporis]EEB15501.1 cytochrome P-450, putative [Pediculus humanus corporis]
MFSVILSIIVIFLIWKLFKLIEKEYILSKIPGPFTYPLLGNVEVFEPIEVTLGNILKRKEKYGPVYKMRAGFLVGVFLTRAQKIEDLIKGMKHLEKSHVYKFVHPWLGTGLLTAHGEKWASHRKLITPSFHFTVLQSFIEIFQENSNILINKLNDVADSDKAVDIFPFITLCLLDVICETAMGTKINAQTDSENEYVKSVYSLSSLIIHRLNRAWLHPDFIYNLTSHGREHKKHLDIVHNFTDSVIRARKLLFENESSTNFDPSEKRKLSFLDLLLKASINEASTPLTDVELREEVDTFMFEGHDTTAAGVNWAILMLSHHPEIQEQAYEEVKTIFENKKGKDLTLGDLSEMALLERIIKETLRLYPSVPTIGRHIDEDTQIGDYLIPKGSNTVLVIYAVHRDPKVFPNPDVFDPDRFLPENSADRHPFAFIPFSAGPRNCIGQKFAMYEEKVVLSNLIYNYRFESVGKLEDVIKIPELVLRPKNGIPVKVYKRN